MIGARRRQSVMKRDGFRCVACGTTDNLTMDHIVPRSKGGSDQMLNLQTMCRPCNGAKGDTSPSAPLGEERS